MENKPTVFLFNDIQAVEEGFFEDINNILSSGEVPNLYKPEEFEEVTFEAFNCLLYLQPNILDGCCILQHKENWSVADMVRFGGG